MRRIKKKMCNQKQETKFSIPISFLCVKHFFSKKNSSIIVHTKIFHPDPINLVNGYIEQMKIQRDEINRNKAMFLLLIYIIILMNNVQIYSFSPAIVFFAGELFEEE